VLEYIFQKLDIPIFLFFYSCFVFYSFFLPKINYSTTDSTWWRWKQNTGVTGVLVDRHLRTNPIDKYGV
jgi:hypothetical protein